MKNETTKAVERRIVRFGMALCCIACGVFSVVAATSHSEAGQIINGLFAFGFVVLAVICPISELQIP